MFNSSNFNEINYLNFDSAFAVSVGDKIKIILGPNGTGKSSIYRNIKNRFTDYSYIDYNDIETSVISKGNEILIGASVVSLEKKEQERQQLLDNLKLNDNLKNFGITSKITAKGVSDNMVRLRDSLFDAIREFDINRILCIFDLDDETQNYFKSNALELIRLEEIRTNIEMLKDSYKKRILEVVDNYLSVNECVCPICDTDKGEPIKQIIARKVLELNALEDNVVRTYHEMYPSYSAEEVLEKVLAVKRFISENELCISDVEQYFICGGEKEKAQHIVATQSALVALDADINALVARKEEFYNNLITNSDGLISTFKLQLSVNDTDIEFNAENKCILIKLPRKVKEYSTGEINLITFITCILEFISNDREVLVIDDPLSSFDIPNQYKIMYEITAAKKQDKKIIIFTHNIDTINIANTQYEGLFEYEILEKKDNTLFLNPIGYNASNSIISVQNLIEKLSDSYEHFDYLQLLLKKEKWEDDDEKHKLFHYDGAYTKTIDGKTYSNDYFVQLINNFNTTTFQNRGFLENTANKIVYTAAIRIWIEKQFYVHSNNDQNLHGKQFGEKVKYIFPSRWTGPSNVTRKYLMSKKVMLNQHIHQKSQSMPFYYCLNLSFENITVEILDIKSRFI